jgi:hypothetical protein
MEVRSLEELNAIRASNRAAMGMSGLGARRGHAGVRSGVRGLRDGFDPTTLLASAAGAAGQTVQVGFVTASPPISYQYSYAPDASGTPTPTRQSATSSSTADWIQAHIIRPVVTVDSPFGQMRYAPGDGQADYSAYANAGAVVLGVGLGLGFLWLVARAFSARRLNRRPSYRSGSTARPRYVLYRRAA